MKTRPFIPRGRKKYFYREGDSRIFMVQHNKTWYYYDGDENHWCIQDNEDISGILLGIRHKQITEEEAFKRFPPIKTFPLTP